VVENTSKILITIFRYSFRPTDE